MSFAQTQTEPCVPASLAAATAYTPSPQQAAAPTFSTLIFRQFVGGSIGGVLLVLVGHPLDTIKTRMQGGEYTTMTAALRSVLHGQVVVTTSDPTTGKVLGTTTTTLPYHRRVTSLYRGASLLLLLQGFYSATLFGFNGIARAMLTPHSPPPSSSLHLHNTSTNGPILSSIHYRPIAATNEEGGSSQRVNVSDATTSTSHDTPHHDHHQNQQQNNQQQQQPLPLSRVLAAALITAPIHTALMTPMDVVKVRLQAMHKASDYKGPVDCIRKMLRGEGAAASTTMSFRSLFAGYGAYAAVRTVGFGPYFVTFEFVKNYLTTPRGASANGTEEGSSSSTSLFHKDSPLVPLIGGSLAGVSYWLAAFPLDTIKTTLQLSRSPLWEGHALRRAHYHRMATAASSSSSSAAAAGTSLPTMRYADALKFILTNGHRQQHYSLKFLYRGFSVAMVRAMPANAAMFFGVKETEKYMIRNGW